jgi:hypothetical protein
MIPLWKGKKPIYFGVIRSKVNVTVTINPLPQGNHVAKFGKDPIYRTQVIMQKRPCSHDSPVKGEEPYLFWGHYHYTV